MGGEDGDERLGCRPPWLARSISRPVHALLQRQPFVAHVLAVFERVLDLVTPAGEVLALVAPEVGDGPLNVVLGAGGGRQAGRDLWTGVETATTVRLEGSCLVVGPAEVWLDGAAVWEPCPDWEALRARRGMVAQRIAELRALAPPAQQGWEEHLALLQAGWEGDTGALRRAAAELAGLGVGLTPAGDDFLCGAMLGAWLLHPDPPAFCRAIVEEAAPRTTTLSAALLRAAGRGECSGAWHALLAELALTPFSREGGNEGLAVALQGILSYGATSGADALAGFLWAVR